VEALAMSPDSKCLAAGRYNGTLSLYEVKTLKEVRGSMTVFDPVKPAGTEKSTEAAIR
jgi:hypothetical protein